MFIERIINESFSVFALEYQTLCGDPTDPSLMITITSAIKQRMNVAKGRAQHSSNMALLQNRCQGDK